MPKIIRAKDLIKLFQENPEAIICTLNYDEDDEDGENYNKDPDIFSNVIIGTVYELPKNENNNSKYIQSWNIFGERSDHNDLLNPEKFINKETVIILKDYVSWYHYEQLKKQENLRVEFEKELEYQKKLLSAAQLDSQEISLKEKINLFLMKFGLGESGRGFSPVEIRNIIYCTESEIRNELEILKNEGKINFTGITKSKRAVDIKLYDKALEKITLENNRNIRPSEP